MGSQSMKSLRRSLVRGGIVWSLLALVASASWAQGARSSVTSIPRSQSVFGQFDDNHIRPLGAQSSAIQGVPADYNAYNATFGNAMTSNIEPPGSIPAISNQPHGELWTDYCDSCGDTCGGSCSGCPNGCERFWVQSELLAWWLNGASVPALVTQSDTVPRAQAGVLGLPTTRILSGAESFGDEARVGTRLTLGGWLGSCHALEGYWMYLGNSNADNFSATSVAGAPILGRPFYNVRDGINDALLVGFPGVVEGTVRVAASSELQSAGFRLRQVVQESRGRRLELLGGYRYLQFKDSIAISENLTVLDQGGLFQLDSTVNLRDYFGAENQWHGGELGLATRVYRGRLTFDLAGKIGLGGIQRKRNVSGVTTVTTPTGATATSSAGLLAAYSNSGSGTQYDFSLLPELNLNLQYQLTDNISLGVGYTLMYVTRVLRAGDMISTQVNPNQLPLRGGTAPFAGAALPAPQSDDSTLRAHGLNFMAEFRF